MKHLILNGFMASGKTTVGRRVAELLQLPFVDLDEVVEGMTGGSVARTFLETGESTFRQIEAEALHRVLRGDPSVIALGGGALQDAENRALAEAKGLIVTLACSARELERRIKNDTSRPLLTGTKEGDRLPVIERLLRDRASIYGNYPIVDTEGGSVEEEAETVVDAYRRGGEGEFGAVYCLDVGGKTSTIVFGPYERVLGLRNWLGAEPSTTAIVTDEIVQELYGLKVVGYLKQHGTAITVAVQGGEAQKNLETLERIYEEFHEAHLDRDSRVIALGGGVVTDITALAAGTYLRGLPLLMLPTTLLAQVDAAIGGKTAVDFRGNKNLIGSFYLPELIVVDVDFLSTLPRSQVSEGLAEIVKVAVVADPGLLDALKELERPTDICGRRDLVRRAVWNKVDIVRQDPYETTGRRALLNLGHTVGHALETVSGFSESHGNCVSLGMVTELKIAASNRELNREVVDEVVFLLDRLGLPVSLPKLDVEAIVSAVKQDKKRSGDTIRMVMVDEVGSAALRPVDARVLRSAVGAANS